VFPSRIFCSRRRWRQVAGVVAARQRRLHAGTPDAGGGGGRPRRTWTLWRGACNGLSDDSLVEAERLQASKSRTASIKTPIARWRIARRRRRIGSRVGDPVRRPHQGDLPVEFRARPFRSTASTVPGPSDRGMQAASARRIRPGTAGRAGRAC